ncbi:MAG: isoleucine--tRNA ligase [archaeon]|nr:MAG: isoleucine--tRNA ligase [archaeon]
MSKDHEFELEILDFWKKKKIFNKLRKKNCGREKFSFIDGPITANNPMGVHHAWGRTYKDLFQRFKAMQGFDQRFQNGFDCQGLWIEVEVEKEKGLKSTQDIEKFGIGKFVDACKDRTSKMAKLIIEQSIRLGQWMDWGNDYFTHSFKANEYKWAFIKFCHEKKWLYKGVDVVPWCPRCSAVQSKHALATEGYEDRKDKAVFLTLPIKGKKDEFFLIWTTTPWTLPANVALAVHPNITYVKAVKNKKIFILAEALAEKILGKVKILEKIKGTELKDMKYEMPYQDLEAQKNSVLSGGKLNETVPAPHKIILWKEVSKEEGTGIVHIAPGCGPEDYALGKEEKLPAVAPLDPEGRYVHGFDWLTGMLASEANPKIIKDLEKRKFLLKVEDYTHSYPHCTRCRTPVVFRLVPEWYISMKGIKNLLMKENKKITWIPEQGQSYEQNWLENMGDWLFSRKRYYGLAMPIWECSCGHFEVIGSAKELKKKAAQGISNFKEHRRPGIDKVLLKCPKCKQLIQRVPDTVDVWMDAALVPFYTLDWLENKKYFKDWYPAELVVESGPGQYRLWFFFMLMAGGILEGRTPFKNVFTYELVKDVKGRAMHKSWGNAIWFDEAIKKLGADLLRYTYVKADPHQNLHFGFELAEKNKRAFVILNNIARYVKGLGEFKDDKKNLRTEDNWILSKLNNLVDKTTQYLEQYQPDLYLKAVENFFILDLSRTYIQIIRDRVQQESKTRNAALTTLFKCYLTVLKLLAPTIPFTTEKIFQDIRKVFNLKEESIHLCNWPKADMPMTNENLEKDFENVLKIIEMGLAFRSESQIGLKWPLSEAKIITKDLKLGKEFIEVIKSQLNVKNVSFTKGKEKEIKVKLNKEITPELKEEGYLRELMRLVQAARKKAGLNKQQKIKLGVKSDVFMKKIIEKNKKELQEKVNASSVKFLTKKEGSLKLKKKIKDQDIEIYF